MNFINILALLLFLKTKRRFEDTFFFFFLITFLFEWWDKIMMDIFPHMMVAGLYKGGPESFAIPVNTVFWSISPLKFITKTEY